MNKRELSRQYTEAVKRLRKQCLDSGITEKEFQEMYFDNVIELNQRKFNKINRRGFFIIYRILALFVVIILTCCYFQSTYNFLVCNIQEYIYPGLRLLRKISIPLISLFPALTDLYQETCFIQNPFFTVADLDCWPCSSVSNIGEMFNPQQVQKDQNAPFIYKSEQLLIDLNLLKEFYEKNKERFDKDNTKVFKNNKHYVNPHEVFDAVTSKGNLYIWKFNHFNAARTLRQLIPRPKIVPKFGQSVERFLIIDSKQESFHIPDTECNYAFLLGLSGTRMIDLQPAEECQHQCKSLKVELRESHLLWYNWWYWRPLVQQSLGNETFIAHVGSYC